MKNNKGFTLIEILVVVAVGVALSTAGFLSYSSFKDRKDLELSLRELGSTVKQIQRRSVTQEDGKRWSVRFNASSTGTDTYEIYSGSSYSESAVEQSYPFRRPVNFSEPSGSRSIDFQFQPVSGELDNKKVITITHETSNEMAGDLIVNTLGVVTERMEDNILGYWHFDEGSGATSTDASGQGHDGSISGASCQSAGSCNAGACLSFDGSNDYVDVGDLSGNIISNPTGEDMSWGGWLNPNNHSADGYIISSGAQVSSAGIYMKMDSSEQINCGIKEESNTVSVSSNSLSTGSFSHSFCVFDQSSGVITVYVDGQAVASSTESSASLSDTETDLVLGSRNDSKGSNVFNGYLDELKIYNRALSAEDVRRMYNDLR